MMRTDDNEIQAYRSRMEAWYASELGEALSRSEARALRAFCDRMHGFQMVIMGVVGYWPGIERCPIPNRLVVRTECGPLSERGGVWGRADRLPIASDSVSAVVLNHALEVAHDPHGTLREVERILVGDGFVVVVGFNPFSLWGVRGYLTRRFGAVPWRLPFYSAGKIREWLNLLGFECLACRFVGAALPLHRVTRWPQLHGLDRGLRRLWASGRGGYVLFARKRRMPMTPMRPRWRPRRGLVPAPLVEPSAYEGVRIAGDD